LFNIPRAVKKKKERKPDWAKAYQSPLNDHFDKIRTWRRARMTWAQIRDKLLQEEKIKVTQQWVQRFFELKTKRKGNVPLGFEPERAAPTSKPAPKPTPPDALGVDVPTTPGTELFKKTKRRYGQ
jgi:hypothetical protein